MVQVFSKSNPTPDTAVVAANSVVGPTIVTLSKFEGHTLEQPINVFLPPDLDEDAFFKLCSATEPPAYEFPALRNWLSKMLHNLKLQDLGNHPFHKNPYKLLEIHVQAVDWWVKKKKLGFMKILTRVETKSDEGEGKNKSKPWLPGAVFLRGGSVAILVYKYSKGEDGKHVILTVQPRVAAGSLAFTEIPAGMLDGEGNFEIKALKEIKEETELEVKKDELVDMSALAAEAGGAAASFGTNGEKGEDAVYPSVGACDEYIPIMLCQKTLSEKEMQEVQGKATGLRKEGERISLKLVPLGEVWKEASRDAKALAAVALYNALKREGKVT
ncbi:hypothetical protein EK21DRAFT_82743 [Setomelanomma holmii]|uniref:Nudix hydrolase domain-containing protein n=1 Tax=Setomelanomma holmii TaxID=210430 RepID=A0A9P4LF10_9PLEO|nr:hypothetical protein EK21DRAFT_82743 [Setomelanomma holmii]